MRAASEEQDLEAVLWPPQEYALTSNPCHIVLCHSRALTQSKSDAILSLILADRRCIYTDMNMCTKKMKFRA